MCISKCSEHCGAPERMYGSRSLDHGSFASFLIFCGVYLSWELSIGDEGRCLEGGYLGNGHEKEDMFA